jgi:quercetin dioxygenase-like cupin family protein
MPTRGEAVNPTLIALADRAAFDPARFTKLDLARGARLFLGLNCFEPGQPQSAHTHADADKFYVVITGKARMRVGTAVVVARAGDLIWCPAGLVHGVEEALERTVLLVGMAPPPGSAG